MEDEVSDLMSQMAIPRRDAPEPSPECPLYDITRCNRRRADHVPWHQSPLATWIALTGLLLTILFAVITFTRTIERMAATIDNLNNARTNDEHTIELMKQEIGLHLIDQSRHLDPQWRTELNGRLQRIENKIDKIR